MSRIFELRPSSLEFERPSSTAARMPSRWARMVLESFTNDGIRDRQAQASHRSRNWWAAPRSRRRYTSRRADNGVLLQLGYRGFVLSQFSQLAASLIQQAPKIRRAVLDPLEVIRIAPDPSRLSFKLVSR